MIPPGELLKRRDGHENPFTDVARRQFFAGDKVFQAAKADTQGLRGFFLAEQDLLRHVHARKSSVMHAGINGQNPRLFTVLFLSGSWSAKLDCRRLVSRTSVQNAEFSCSGCLERIPVAFRLDHSTLREAPQFRDSVSYELLSARMRIVPPVVDLPLRSVVPSS